MYKLVVLSALLAAAAAKPEVFFTGPLAPTTYVATAPAATAYLQSSSYYPAPAVYSSLSSPHFIKKRSAPFYTSYVAPSTYLASSPLATTYSAVLPSASYYSAYPGYAAGLPFIKK